jgi:hypothetical protein
MLFHRRDAALAVDTFFPYNIVKDTQYIKSVGEAITDMGCVESL